MKKNTPKKLALNKETLRSLGEGPLAKAAGGTTDTDLCPSQEFTQCPISHCIC